MIKRWLEHSLPKPAKKKFALLFSVFLMTAANGQSPQPDSLRQLLRSTADPKKTLDLYVKLATYYQDVNIDSALAYANKGLALAKKLKDPKAVANAELGLSFLHTASGGYEESHRHAFAAQRIGDSLKDDALLSRSANSIGYVYAKLNNQKEAIRYYRMGIRPAENLSNAALVASIYNNIGNAYMALKAGDSALWYLHKGLDIRKGLKDLKGMSYSYNNIGNVYADRGDFKKSGEYYLQSLRLKEQLGDVRGIISSYNNLSYNEFNSGNYAAAKKYIEDAVSLSNKISLKDYLHDAYEMATEVYSKTGDYRKAFDYYRLLYEMDKNMFSENMTKQITEAQAKYESVKKEKEIALLKKDQDMNLLEISKQRYINYGVIAILVLVLSLTFFVYRGYTQKNRSNKLLHQKNEIIEARNKDILDSINYARRIQEAVLPKAEDIGHLLQDYFIFYQPRDIVSGDFYFIEPIRTNDGRPLAAVAVADCTGHGVPGAFMSMLGYDILKNSLSDRNVNSAAEALDYLNSRLTKVLRATSDTQVRDGMDIAFCVYDPVGMNLYFSGANNPCWIIRSDKTLVELRPDKQPIGFFENNIPFTLKSAKLEKGDMFYLFTDGYADQFGGPQGKKFKYKQLKSTLLSIVDMPVERQKEELKKQFATWKGKLEQIDDVTLLGVRV